MATREQTKKKKEKTGSKKRERGKGEKRRKEKRKGERRRQKEAWRKKDKTRAAVQFFLPVQVKAISV